MLPTGSVIVKTATRFAEAGPVSRGLDDRSAHGVGVAWKKLGGGWVIPTLYSMFLN